MNIYSLKEIPSELGISKALPIREGLGGANKL